jgi:hypothetical protein
LTTPKYEQWKPEEYDPGEDPLSAQVGARESEDVVRDPEVDTAPTITRIGNLPPQPVAAVVDHSPHDPNGPVVDRVEQAHHLLPRRESTDRFGDAALDSES